MKAEEVLAALEDAGTAQNRKVYARHGVRGPAFGVSYANLGKLARALKRDHAVALALWDSGNHDARVLATMVADPERADVALLERWMGDVDNYVLGDALAKLAAASPAAQACQERWWKARDEWRSAVGWSVLAMRAAALPQAEAEQYLRAIESDLARSPNRTRHAMNNALIALGCRPELQAKAIQVARRLGKVEVDHGETGCKTPPAEDYILKASAYQRGRSGNARPARRSARKQ